MKIILASSSPRRKDLLNQIGFDFEIIVSDVDEDIGERDPAELVKKLAYAKANAVAGGAGDAIIIGADTIVWIDDEILGKPADAEHAFKMLKQLSGRAHRVYTGLAIFNTATNERKVTVDETDVYFRELSDEEINAYIATGEPMDKAGAYGLQGRAAMFVRRIEGDYFTVVGLPLYRLSGL
jgi:septum formation protein